ncbi:MAG: M48 family metalloprotease [Arenicellales bacterium]
MLRKVLQASCLAAVMAVSLGAVPGAAVAQENLPTLGRGTMGLSKMDEEKLGRQFMRQARQTMDFITDPELTQYINELGHRLSSHSDEPNDAFHFYLIRDPQLNAFAVPGGYIVVNTGLVMATENEPELAAVMAHEIAHITQHHLSQMVEDTKGQGFKLLGALVAAILLGGQAGSAAVVGANATAISNQLRYQRGFEQEADDRGIHTMAEAGYDPHAMAQFFKVLERWSRNSDTGGVEFLRDHPLTPNRIADAEVRADQYPRPKPPDETDFYHVRAKIRAMYSDDPEAAAERFAANLKSGKYESENAERYGYALALSRAGRHKEAIQVIGKLIQQYPDSMRYQAARGNILMAAGRFDEAIGDFAQSHERWPDSRPLDIYYATALVQTKHYEQAKRLLKHRLLTDKDDAQLYSLLARAEGEMGNSLVAHQDLAEYYYLRADLPKAYRQLKLAQKYVDGSEYAKASIEARIKDVQREMQIYDEKTDKTKDQE